MFSITKTGKVSTDYTDSSYAGRQECKERTKGSGREESLKLRTKEKERRYRGVSKLRPPSI